MEKASASPSAAQVLVTEKAKKDAVGKNIGCEPDEPVINYRGIYAMPFIMGNEIFEKLGTIGSQQNLVLYLSTVFNMSSVKVTTIHNVFTGTTNLTPLLGGFLADTYFGRYATVGVACIASLLGLTLLMLTAAVESLHPPKCIRLSRDTKCVGPTSSQVGFILAAFAFMIIGAAGIRPCNLAFGADQFNPNTESGKRGTASFFNWYYFTYTFATMIAMTLIVYVQTDISWAIGLAIPAGLMLLAVVIYFVGTRIYVIVKPQGSPFTGMVQVIAASFRKRGNKLPENPAFSLYNYTVPKSLNTKLPHTTQFRCLDKAAIITDEDEFNPDGSAKNPWRICSIQQVEELKCLVRLLPIWASAIIYNIPIVQQQTYTVFQALQSDRHLGNTSFQIPPASFIVFSMLALTIWVPIYDQLLVPYLQKITKKEGGLTVLQRMGIGMVLSILCSFVSAAVEVKRKNIAETRPTLGISQTGGIISSMSSMWLVPQLAIAGLSEAFNYIAQVEFYYTQFPENMRSVAGSIFWASYGIANYLSSFIISVVHDKTKKTKNGDWLPNDLNDGKLDYFYYVVGGLGVLNFFYFLVCAWWYKYKPATGNTTFDVEIAKEADQESTNPVLYMGSPVHSK